MNELKYYIYILTNQKNGALYVGITNDLIRRVAEHKEKKIDGFTKEYGIDKLIYYETYAKPGQAIYREKCLKEWHRDWKIKLIEKNNPTWQDLYNKLL